MEIKEIEYCLQSNQTDQVFSVLIPSWNNLPYLKLCVESIRKNSTYRHQIIIHINEGSDGTLDWIQTQTDLDYTFSKKNIGICYAMNISSRLSYTNYIVYLNDDMYVCPQWDYYLLEEIKSIDTNLFFISATSIQPVLTSNCVIKGDFGKDITSFKEEELVEKFSSFEKEDWQGATWPPNIVSKEMWNTVGGYSVEFSPGLYSDPDFSKKLWDTGVRYFKGVSASRVYHFGSLSVNRINKNKGYFTFILKWGMTAGTFSKKYLKRGQQFNGPLMEPNLAWNTKLKSLFKQLIGVFKR